MNKHLNSNMLTGLKTRRQKFGISSLLFFILFGAVFTGVGGAVLKQTKVDPNWARESGRITSSSSSMGSSSTTYAAVVEYQVNGQTYHVTSSISSSSQPQIGATRQVAYNPSQPNQAKVVESTGSTWWLYLFPAIGITFIVLGPLLFMRSLKRSRNIDHLVHSGLKLQGILTDVQNVGGDTNNSGYKIIVSATDNTGTVQNYVSDTLRGIGGLAMADFRSNPIPIDVYIDPSNPENYYVDVSDIPNLTPERIKELVASAMQSKQAATFTNGEQPPTPPPNIP